MAGIMEYLCIMFYVKLGKTEIYEMLMSAVGEETQTHKNNEWFAQLKREIISVKHDPCFGHQLS
jgi:hypothetical protein